MALTSIMEMVETDARGRSPDEQEMAMIAVDRTRKLSRLARDLLEISRFDAGAVELRLEMIDVALADTLQTRGWSEDVELVPTDAVLARFDVRRLDVAVANLVGNALRARPTSDRRRGAGAVRRRVRRRDRPRPGFPDDVDTERLFTRF